MRRLATLATPLTFLFLVCASGSAQATTIQVASPGALGASDALNWATIGAEYTFQASPWATTSTGGVGITASNPGDIGFTRLTEGSSFFGDFLPGSPVVFGGDPFATPFTTSMTLDFLTPVFGVGARFEAVDPGAFTAQIQLYDAGNVLLGTFNINGVQNLAADGSAPYLGGRSDAAEITKAIFTLTSFTDAGNGYNGFGVGQIDLNTGASEVPEPATLSLVGIGAAIGAYRRRQAKKK